MFPFYNITNRDGARRLLHAVAQLGLFFASCIIGSDCSAQTTPRGPAAGTSSYNTPSNWSLGGGLGADKLAGPSQ